MVMSVPLPVSVLFHVVLKLLLIVALILLTSKGRWDRASQESYIVYKGFYGMVLEDYKIFENLS